MYNILVVDDEKSVRESLKLILEDNYKIFLATSGKEAIEKLLSEHIDLMLLDIRMPGISGLDVLKQVEKVAKDIEVCTAGGMGVAAIMESAKASDMQQAA